MSNKDRQIRLRKDIVIPAGTIMSKAPTKTVRHGDDHFDCVIGLTDDSCGFFSYCVDDGKLDDWFEEVDRHKSTIDRLAGWPYGGKLTDRNTPDSIDKSTLVKEKFKDGDWVFGIGENKGCSQVFTGGSGDFQPFSYLNDYDPNNFRTATDEEVINSKNIKLNA